MARSTAQVGTLVATVAILVIAGGVGLTDQALCNVVWSSEKSRSTRLETADVPVPRPPRQSLDQAIDRLQDFGDNWSGSMASSTIIPRASYRYERSLPRSIEIQKVVQRIRDEKVVPAASRRFKHELKRAAEGFEKAFWEKDKLLSAAANAGHGLDLHGPDEDSHRRTNAPIAAYMLAELQCYDALPLMAQVFEQPGRLPLSRLFLYYSMHLLAVSHPQEGLSPQALQALQEYRESTKDLTKPKPPPTTARPQTKEEAAMHALFNRDVDLDKPPQPGVLVYPKAVEAYEEMDDRCWYQITDEGKRHFSKLRRFIDLAYPQR